MFKKTAYVCGALTELSRKKPGLLYKLWFWLCYGIWNTSSEYEAAKQFYERIADTYHQVMGVRAFVPHEHYDPVLHADFTPAQVYESENNQVCQKTAVLIVVTIAPSWGGGMEVEWANQHSVPIVIISWRGKKISRLLRGVPTLKYTVEYDTHDEALVGLKKALVLLNLQQEALVL